MSPGAVAAGNPDTVRAGMEVLRSGGNAVDAAIASLLMAAVSEPMLTGPAGAGLAMVRFGGEVTVCDMFTDMPGLGRLGATAPKMDAVSLDFGPTQQRFEIGPGSCAPPGIPAGIELLHRRFGSLPMADLAAPAIAAAESGVVIQPEMVRILAALWPICQTSPALSKLIGPTGRAPVAGEIHRNPGLAHTLRQFVQYGESVFRTGIVAQSMLDTLGDRSLLCQEDLVSYQAHFREPLRFQYRDATLWVPGIPSVAGLLVLQTLRELEDLGPMPPDLGAEQVRLMVAAMTKTERSRGQHFNRSLFQPGFVEGFLSSLSLHQEGDDWRHTPQPEPSTGHTTHISIIDSDGNAAGITTSLGESCGLIAGDTGVILNNFLGEADVNPPNSPRDAGQRLTTMCCPTLMELGDQAYIMGSAGSSRIRSAVLHGLVYLTDHRMAPASVVSAPRSHVEGTSVSIEEHGRPEGTQQQLDDILQDIRWFEEPNMYFGGLNIAGKARGGFVGAGDNRRSGCFQSA